VAILVKYQQRKSLVQSDSKIGTNCYTPTSLTYCQVYVLLFGLLFGLSVPLVPVSLLCLVSVPLVSDYVLRLYSYLLVSHV